MLNGLPIEEMSVSLDFLDETTDVASGPPSGGAINKKDINTEKISMAPAQG